MLEMLLLTAVTLAGGVWAIRQQRRRAPDDMPALLVLARSGFAAMHKPHETPTPVALETLLLIVGGLRVVTAQDSTRLLWREVLWVQPLAADDNGMVTLQLHSQHAQQWRVLTLTLSAHDMLGVTSALKRSVPRTRWARPNDPQPAWYRARLAQQSLQGEITKGAEIGVYLVGQWLLILHADVVYAKLALKAIRRVLAVVRGDKPREGLVRLYSRSETLLLVSPSYHALASDIALRADCPLEHVDTRAKASKTL